MRILIANEALSGGGGVETYLEALVRALLDRGHDVGLLHDNPSSEPGPVTIAPDGMWRASVQDEGIAVALERVKRFAPDVCFSHNMRSLEIDAALLAFWPVVKMMHGHTGTCVSGQKAWAFPHMTPCSRGFGPGCLAHYFPHHCGQLRPLKMFKQYAWGTRQRALFDRYSGIVVASGFMAEEFRRAGAPADRLHVLPLFVPPSQPADPREIRRADVLFLGRMTSIKGGDVLLRAVAETQTRLHRPLSVVMAGDGPEHDAWQRLAGSLGLAAEFPGWVSAGARGAWLHGTAMMVVPSRWAEPFGLVGLEAAACGTPVVAFNVGGISEWLTHGLNGLLVEPGDGARGLAEAIADLVSNPGTRARLSAGGRAVAARFTIDRHVASVEAVLGAAPSIASAL